MRVAIVGNGRLGGVKMRGVAVANACGFDFIDLKDVRQAGHYDTVVLVKYWADKAKLIRKMCDRLIFDPLDCFSSLGPHQAAETFWPATRRELGYDDIIATSNACSACMTMALKGMIPTHVLRHHADPRIESNWYDPDGHVVYAGGIRYLGDHLTELSKACESLGSRYRLVVNDSRDPVPSLYGASIAIHLRMPPYDSPLHRWCKPQVKLENAAAAGLRCVATPHQCAKTVKATGVEWWDGSTSLASALLAARARPKGPQDPVTLEKHAAHLIRIIQGQGTNELDSSGCRSEKIQ